MLSNDMKKNLLNFESWDVQKLFISLDGIKLTAYVLQKHQTRGETNV